MVLEKGKWSNNRGFGRMKEQVKNIGSFLKLRSMGTVHAGF